MADITQINHSDIPIRLFKSDILEFFTHIHPAVIVAIWAPVMLMFLFKSMVEQPAGAAAASIPASFAIGLAVWTFAEYMLHRFVFHFKPRTPRQGKIIFLFHGVHHEQPQLKTRLVMPPVVSIPMAFVFYGLFSLAVGGVIGASTSVDPMFSGFILGYLIYDLTHYATHHIPMRSGIFKFLKQHHMKHHFKTPDQRFGVSSAVWDRVFGTLPAD